MRITCLALKLNTVDGGGSNYALDFQLRHLHSQDHEVRLITLFSSQNKLREKTPYTVIDSYRTDGSFIPLQSTATQILFAEENRTDIFYLDGQSLLWGAGRYRKNSGQKPVAAYVNYYTSGMGLTHEDRSNFLYRLKRLVWEKIIGLKMVNHLDLFIMNSPVIRDEYVHYGFNAKKIILLPLEMTVTTDKHTTEPPPFTKKETELHLLYAGRLVHDKGIDLLIEALHDKNLNTVVAHIVGTGQEKTELIALTKKYHLESNIQFYDWLSPQELASFYHSADVFVHPCRWLEPFGRTIVEALSWGKPVITSQGTGAAWIADGAGKIFPINDVEKLREAILYFRDKKNIADYGARAKTRAREFDFINFTPQFEAALENLKNMHSADNRAQSE